MNHWTGRGCGSRGGLALTDSERHTKWVQLEGRRDRRGRDARCVRFEDVGGSGPRSTPAYADTLDVLAESTIDMGLKTRKDSQ